MKTIFKMMIAIQARGNWAPGSLTFIPKKMEFTEFLLDNLTNDSEELRYGLSMLYCWVTAFHENFYLFPISSKRTIVLINPFFKFILMNSDTFRLDFSTYTILNDKRLFLPNKSTCYSLGEHKDDDTYTYVPVQLTPFETRYCNCLIMDRIDTWLGFSSLDAVRGSAEQYREMTKGYARNAYAELYDILSKSQYKYWFFWNPILLWLYDTGYEQVQINPDFTWRSVLVYSHTLLGIKKNPIGT